MAAFLQSSIMYRHGKPDMLSALTEFPKAHLIIDDTAPKW